jgi:hypothetical protein
MTNPPQPSLSERLNRSRTAYESPEERDTTEVAEELARGRSPATPFVLLGSVAFAVWSAVAVVALAAVLIWWLV